nr:TPA_asm: hypothetical protein HUJ06_002536 [Nelumbo nucifera]
MSSTSEGEAATVAVEQPLTESPMAEKPTQPDKPVKEKKVKALRKRSRRRQSLPIPLILLISSTRLKSLWKKSTRLFFQQISGKYWPSS